MTDEPQLPRDGDVSLEDVARDGLFEDTLSDVSQPSHESDDVMNDFLSTYDIAGVALGAADANETARVESAVEADLRVRHAFAAMQNVVAQLSVALPQQQKQQINRGRSAGIRSRLVSKAAASREGRTSVPRKTAELLQPWFKRPGVGGADTGATEPDAVRRSPEQGLGRGRQIGHGAVGGGAVNPSADTGRERPVRPEVRVAPPARRQQGSVLPWLAVVALVAIVVGGIQQWRLIHAQHQVQATAVTDQESALTIQVAQLKTLVAAKDSVIQSLAGPNMAVIDLINYSSHDPLARMFWDQERHEWTLHAYHMRQPKPGETFQIWLFPRTSAKPISVGTFQPDAQGEAVVKATYSLDRNALLKVAVSEEPTGGVAYPTGPMVVAGAAR